MPATMLSAASVSNDGKRPPSTPMIAHVRWSDRSSKLSGACIPPLATTVNSSPIWPAIAIALVTTATTLRTRTPR